MNLATCRAEITGQFSTDNPCSAWNNTEVKVERELAATTMTPSNWSSFCDSADVALQPLLATKKTFKLISSTFSIFFAVFFGFMLVNHTFIPLQRSIGTVYLAVPYLLIMITFAIFWFWIRSKLKQTMSDVEKVCQQYSDTNDDNNSSNNGFRYTLHSEHWGGCNKPHVKRYFITLHAPSGTEGGNSHADIEQPVVAAPVAAYAPAPAPAPAPTAAPPTNDVFQDTPSSVAATSGGGGKGPSIFDQLSGK